MTTSSAVPADLITYARDASTADERLGSTAQRLHLTLQAFRASRPEFGAAPDLEPRISALARTSGDLDAWVGRVGEAFEHADRRPGRAARVPDKVLVRQLERDNRRDGAPLQERYAATRREIERARDDTATALAHARGDERTRLKGRLDTLNGLLADSAGHPRQFLFFDPRGDGRVAEVVGDLEHADRVAVIVPGMDNPLDKFGKLANDARLLQTQASQEPGGHNVATIAWLGYDTPDALPGGGWDVTHKGRAKEAALSLVDFMRGLRLQSGARTTVIGHSYGSLVTGLAVRDGLRADNVVFIGSPGVGVDHVEELHAAKGTHFYAGRAVFDPVGYSEWFGRDPADGRFGATTFATGRSRKGLVSGHADANYFTEYSTSLQNLSRITNGDYAHVTKKSRTLEEDGAVAFDRAERAANGVVHQAEAGIDSLQHDVDRRVDGVHHDIEDAFGPLGWTAGLGIDAGKDLFDGAVDNTQGVADSALHALEAPLDLTVDALDRASAMERDVWDEGSDFAGNAWDKVSGLFD